MRISENIKTWSSPTINILKIILFLSLIGLVWGVSETLVTNAYDSIKKLEIGDRATLLFGAASLALFLFSTLIAFLAAVFGWGTVQGIVREKVEATITDKIKILESELRGRVASVLGHAIGEMSIASDLRPIDKERLAEAVRQCQIGYEFLKLVGGPAEYLGLNNLVFYSCIANVQSRSSFLLEKGRLLKDAGQEHNAANLQLTGCRAILQYGSDPEEKNRARLHLESIKTDINLSAKDRREAGLHLDVFPNAVMPQAGPKGRA